MSPDRDRDDAGPARNARPRDASGRPLELGDHGVLPVDDVPRTSQEALDDAERLLAEERPFAAHEVLEGAWKSAPVDERDLWQGLAQVAVALTHAQRGNAVGASALLERAHERLGAYAGTTPHDIDVDGVLQRLVEYAASIQRSGLPIPLQMRLRVR